MGGRAATCTVTNRWGMVPQLVAQVGANWVMAGYSAIGRMEKRGPKKVPSPRNGQGGHGRVGLYDARHMGAVGWHARCGVEAHGWGPGCAANRSGKAVVGWVGVIHLASKLQLAVWRSAGATAACCRPAKWSRAAGPSRWQLGCLCRPSSLLLAGGLALGGGLGGGALGGALGSRLLGGGGLRKGSAGTGYGRKQGVSG